jgi:hypothetical protein
MYFKNILYRKNEKKQDIFIERFLFNNHLISNMCLVKTIAIALHKQKKISFS